ncbi:MAG: hypothetical protein ACK2TX_01495, partial [Anaerolineales bacterium]
MSSHTVSRRGPVVRRTTAAEFNFTEEDVRQRSKASGEPKWLAQRRLAAWKRYREMPMPTTKDEPWRRTDIRSLPAQDLSVKPADDRAVDPALLEPLAGEEHGSLIVIRPGHEPRLELDPALTEQGVVFT